MGQNNLCDLCFDKKWDKVQEFLDSDASTNKVKKREVVCYQGLSGWTCLHWACRARAPVDIIKSLLDSVGDDDNFQEGYSTSLCMYAFCIF